MDLLPTNSSIRLHWLASASTVSENDHCLGTSDSGYGMKRPLVDQAAELTSVSTLNMGDPKAYRARPSS